MRTRAIHTLSPYLLMDIGFWLLLWFAAFATTMLYLYFEVPLHGNLVSILGLIGRDLTFAFFGFRLFILIGGSPTPWVKIRFIDLISLITIFVLGYFYVVHCYQSSFALNDRPLIFVQRHPLMLVRAFTLVFFQQLLSTHFLIEKLRTHLNDQTSIIYGAVIFGLVHLLGGLIGLSLPMSILLSLLSSIAMFVWGWLRVFYRSYWTPLLIHFGFYLVTMIAVQEFGSSWLP